MAFKRQNYSLQEWVQMKGDTDGLVGSTKSGQPVNVVVVGDGITGCVESITTCGKFTPFPSSLGLAVLGIHKNNACRGTFVWVKVSCIVVRSYSPTFPLLWMRVQFSILLLVKSWISHLKYMFLALWSNCKIWGCYIIDTALPWKEEAVDLSSYHFQY